MLDVKFVVANAEAVKENCRNRNTPADVLDDVDRVVELEGERRGAAPGRGRDSPPPERSRPGHRQGARPAEAIGIDRGRQGAQVCVADEEEKLRRLEGELNLRLRRIPNLTHPDAPLGRDRGRQPRDPQIRTSRAPSTSSPKTTSSWARSST